MQGRIQVRGGGGGGGGGGVARGAVCSKIQDRCIYNKSTVYL